MLLNTASPALEPASPTRPLPDFLQGVAQLFEDTRPEASRRVAFAWWLLAATVGAAVVRLWGLGDVGLHGDEETMAMAVQHILVDGRPILPSGMFYPRGMTQLYLMALSVSIFGETEWALRLPSVLCGVALVPLAYFAGRRFLRPEWSLALAATVAFLPDLIVYSQTARMYIFLIACVTASMTCLFAWERTQRAAWLVASVAFLIVGMDMQLLAVGVVLMFLLPGLLRGDLRSLLLGAAATAAGTIAFVAFDAFTSAQYPVPPPEFAADFDLGAAERSRALPQFTSTSVVALWLSGIAIVAFTFHVARRVTPRTAAWASAILLLAAAGLQLAIYYHLAAFFYLAGSAVAIRFGATGMIRRLIPLYVAAAALAAVHAVVVAQTTDTVVRFVGAMVGEPSVWPYMRAAQPSPIAGLLVAMLLAWGVYRYAQCRKMSDVWLFAVLAVLAPTFALGLFAWNMPSRYTTMSLIPMLLCAFAFAQGGWDWLRGKLRFLAKGTLPSSLAAASVALLAINPAKAAATIDAGYRIHPDHKGAAEFMRSLPLTDEDIVLAEDVLQQTYYLGEVDYWLIGPRVARRYIKSTNAGVVDFYTGTPVVVSAAMLDKVLLDNADKRIFVIGSGEGHKTKRRYARGEELLEAIESDRFEVIYTGRDGVTQVLRAVPGRLGSGRGEPVPRAESSREHSIAEPGSGAAGGAPGQQME